MTGFAQSYGQLAILRIITCMGLGCLYIGCNTLMSEMVPTKYRTTVLATLMTGYTLGSLTITGLSGWIIPEFGHGCCISLRLSRLFWLFSCSSLCLNLSHGEKPVL